MDNDFLIIIIPLFIPILQESHHKPAFEIDVLFNGNVILPPLFMSIEQKAVNGRGLLMTRGESEELGTSRRRHRQQQ